MDKVGMSKRFGDHRLKIDGDLLLEEKMMKMHGSPSKQTMFILSILALSGCASEVETEAILIFDNGQMATTWATFKSGDLDRCRETALALNKSTDAMDQNSWPKTIGQFRCENNWKAIGIEE